MATDPVVLAARLVEAETALHNLSIGLQEVKVDTGDGRSITYTQTKIGQLRAYIADLKAQLNPTDTTMQRRPLRPLF